MKKTVLIIALLIPLLYSCKKEPDPINTPTTEEKARDYLYDLMKVAYLWYKYIPTVKVSDYEGPYDLLEAIRYKPLDKWSRVWTWEQYLAMVEGSFVGHGIRMGLDDDDNVRVVSLYTGSDLWPKGVRRGWIVKSVNGTLLAPIFISGDDAAYNAVMGLSTAGITNDFLFIKPDGTEVTYSSTKASFTINTVSSPTILNLTSGKTGYFAFDSFIEPSVEELNDAFADFKANNITDLIIDLRYNPGGMMDVAEQLASLVMNPADTTKECYGLEYNDLVAASWNITANFIRTESPLGLNRVVFITSRSSASASEVVINSLKPYISVTLVGDTTYGKPTGMDGFGYPATPAEGETYDYVFFPVTFEYVNSLGEGRFYDGIPADILAADDITHDFGDPEEASLAAAIAYLEGSKAEQPTIIRNRRIHSEGDQLPKDLFRDPRQSPMK
jgi:carboxyl-terminal processing protease